MDPQTFKDADQKSYILVAADDPLIKVITWFKLCLLS